MLFQRISLTPHNDSRGTLVEALNPTISEQLGAFNFPHALLVDSDAETMRGFHFQLPCQGKLIFVIKGKVTLMGVDLREAPPTYKDLEVLPTYASRDAAFYLPPGCGFGYITHEPATLLYLTTQPRSEYEYSVNMFPTWELKIKEMNFDGYLIEHFLRSAKDEKAPSLDVLEQQQILPLNDGDIFEEKYVPF